MHRFLFTLGLLTTSVESTAAERKHEDASYQASMTAVGIAIAAIGGASGAVGASLLVAPPNDDARIAGILLGASGALHIVAGLPIMIAGAGDVRGITFAGNGLVCAGVALAMLGLGIRADALGDDPAAAPGTGTPPGDAAAQVAGLFLGGVGFAAIGVGLPLLVLGAHDVPEPAVVAPGIIVTYLGTTATLLAIGLIADGDNIGYGWGIGTLVSGIGHLAVGVPLIVRGSIDETPTSSLRIHVSPQGGAANVSW